MEEKLTEKQMKFCQEYLLDFNGTQAAIRAGYSEESARQIATENLSKPAIQCFLEKLKKEAAETFGISKQSLIDELAKIAFFDIRSIYTENNSLKNIHDFDDKAAGAVAGIDVDEIWGTNEDGERERIGETVKVKLNSKIQAIERVSKMLGYDSPIKNETKVTGVTINYNTQPGNDPLPE